MNIHRVYRALVRGFRRRRMRHFVGAFRPGPETTVLDVGGSAFNWEIAGASARITLLNLVSSAETRALAHRYTLVSASGTQLPYRDGAFDVVFSNSVIEHLGSLERQQAFANEVARVGRGIFVQTPARGFFLEPHLLTPFVHHLPRAWQRRLLRRFTLWGWLARPTPEAVDRFVADTRLLDGREMRALFPDCEIRRERFLGMTKSYLAIRHGDDG
jgi:hypothetical protein